MSIHGFKAVYDGANVTGRFTQRHLTNEGLFNHAIGHAVHNRNAAGLKAVKSRIVVNTLATAGSFLAMDRVISPVQLATAVVQRSPCAGLYPVAEVIFGRGTTPTNRFANSERPLLRIAHQWEHLTQHGLLGRVLEKMPMQHAAALEARGADKMAQACIAGAILGRVVLQIPRTAVVLWAICEVAIAVACVTTLFLALEGSARSARWVIEGISPRQPGAQLSNGRQSLDELINLLSWQMVPVIAQAAQPDDMGNVAPTAADYSNTTVARRTNAAIVHRFADFTGEIEEDSAALRAAADSIAEDLRQYCSRAPDNSALRGGLSILNNFMEMTYEEAEWPKPPELA